ncbi:hypothetical protein EJB05_55993, partial [Eragrostis curvula]
LPVPPLSGRILARPAAVRSRLLARPAVTSAPSRIPAGARIWASPPARRLEAAPVDLEGRARRLEAGRGAWRMDPNNSSKLELLDMICEMSEDPLNLSVPCPSIAEPSLETQTQSADDNSLANPNPSRSKKKLHVE